MIKVLKPGKKDSEVVATFNCANCGCEWLASSPDAQRQFDRNERYFSCKCPTCGKEVWSL